VNLKRRAGLGENGVVGGAIGRKPKFHLGYLAGLWQEK